MPKEEPVDKKNSLAFLRRRGKKKKKDLISCGRNGRTIVTGDSSFQAIRPGQHMFMKARSSLTNLTPFYEWVICLLDK